MKFWIPAAVLVLAAAAFVLFYTLATAEKEGASSFGLVNLVGLATVVLGITAAFVMLRRASPP
ncbi:MAG: hypothetical protein HY296_06570 [Thaumarchaeota archaeon]|nr:hypothetical protein [Nitrososphaerota archaeon]